MTNSTESHPSGFITFSEPPDPPYVTRPCDRLDQAGALFLTLPTRGLTGQHVIFPDGYGASMALS
jgi:hypothetical protein